MGPADPSDSWGPRQRNGATHAANRGQFAIVLSPQLLQANAGNPWCQCPWSQWQSKKVWVQPPFTSVRSLRESCPASKSLPMPFPLLETPSPPCKIPPLSTPKRNTTSFKKSFSYTSQAIRSHSRPPPQVTWMQVSLGAPFSAACACLPSPLQWWFHWYAYLKCRSLGNTLRASVSTGGAHESMPRKVWI